MDTGTHTRHQLFAQLGLAADDSSIEHFIAQHSPLAENARLSEAPFWTPSQASFLNDALRQDAEWAVVIDQLDLSLRGK